ncbi:hypothetical protein WEH80_22445 [Actinomycetes bacterium KLBMP 9759]
MAETLSLMEFLRALSSDDALRTGFAADPTATLSAHGLDGLSPDDVYDALVLIEDTQTASFDLDYGAASSGAHSVPPPPGPVHGDAHEAAVEYLTRYVTSAGAEQTDQFGADPYGDDDGFADQLGDLDEPDFGGAVGQPAVADFGSGNSSTFGRGDGDDPGFRSDLDDADPWVDHGHGIELDDGFEERGPEPDDGGAVDALTANPTPDVPAHHDETAFGDA